MDLTVLNYIFNLCILLGIAVPLLNIVTGWLGGLFGGGVDADADIDVDADMDADTGNGGGAIPFNIMCLCLFLVVFGALGQAGKRFMTSAPLMAALLTGCLAAAAAAYWALYKFVIKRLKKNDASALSYRDLPGKSGEVTLGLSGDSMGTVSLRDSTGAAISFRAKIDPHLKDRMPDGIPKGETVVITEADAENKLCYISMPYHKLMKNQIQTG